MSDAQRVDEDCLDGVHQVLCAVCEPTSTTAGGTGDGVSYSHLTNSTSPSSRRITAPTWRPTGGGAARTRTRTRRPRAPLVRRAVRPPDPTLGLVGARDQPNEHGVLILSARFRRPLPELFEEVQVEVHSPHLGYSARVDPVEGELLDSDGAAGGRHAVKAPRCVPVSVRCAAIHGPSTARWRSSQR
jgi:hypothetical protein